MGKTRKISHNVFFQMNTFIWKFLEFRLNHSFLMIKTEMKPEPYILSFVYFWEETMVSPMLRAYGLSELIRMLGENAQGATAVTTWGPHGRLSHWMLDLRITCLIREGLFFSTFCPDMCQGNKDKRNDG